MINDSRSNKESDQVSRMWSVRKESKDGQTKTLKIHFALALSLQPSHLIIYVHFLQILIHPIETVLGLKHCSVLHLQLPAWKAGCVWSSCVRQFFPWRSPESSESQVFFSPVAFVFQNSQRSYLRDDWLCPKTQI